MTIVVEDGTHWEEIVVEDGTHWEEIEAVAWNSDGTKIVGKDTLRYSGVGDAT